MLNSQLITQAHCVASQSALFLGDQTAHLQWRLLHGQLLIQNPPKVAVLMIGTNDLGADSSCFEWNTTLAQKAVNKVFTRYLAPPHLSCTHSGIYNVPKASIFSLLPMTFSGQELHIGHLATGKKDACISNMVVALCKHWHFLIDQSPS